MRNRMMGNYVGWVFIALSTFVSAQEIGRRHDPSVQIPRVFREVLPGYPRSIIGKVDEKLWLSYDLSRGELTNAWTPREDGAAILIQGITSDGTHGDTSGSNGVFPQILGTSLFKKSTSQSDKLLEVNGKPSVVECHESTFDETNWVITWRYLRSDQTFGYFTEAISFDPQTKSLVRIFAKKEGNRDELDSFPKVLRMDGLKLTDVDQSFPVFRKQGRNFDKGTAAPLEKDERGGFRKRLNNLHPGYDSLDLTALFGDHNIRVGGLDLLPNGDLLVAAWEPRGGVYRISNPSASKLSDMKLSVFAEGLHAPLGLLVHEGRVYVAEKHQLTELIDRDKDGFAETHHSVCSTWGAGMNFHQFTFGPVFKNGKFLLALSVNVLSGGATGKDVEKDRGCLIAVDPKTHDYEVVAAGLRTPNGLGHGPAGSVLVLDNQGDYKPANPILSIEKGAFYHHKYSPAHPLSHKKPTWPAVWLPQGVYGNSLSDPLLITDGLFKDQVFFGDVRYGGLKRAFFEKVEDRLQGGAIRYSGGIRGGTNRIRQNEKGDLFIGVIGSGGNWGRDAKQGIQRLRPNGKKVFEILKVELRKNGFVIRFTEPLKEKVGWNVKAYSGRSYWFKPTSQYGGSPMNVKALKPISASVSSDRKSVFLEVDGIRSLRHYQIHLPKRFETESGQKIWTGDIHYTVVNTSKKMGEVIPAPSRAAVAVNPAPERQNVDPMHVVYQSLCMGCHSLDGTAVAGPSFKDMAGQTRTVIRNGKEVEQAATLEYIMKSIREPGADLVKGHQPTMPLLAPAIGEDKIEDLAKYILKLGGGSAVSDSK